MKTIFSATSLVCLLFISGMLTSCERADANGPDKINHPQIDYRKPAVPVQRIPPPPVPATSTQSPPKVSNDQLIRPPAKPATPGASTYPAPDSPAYNNRKPAAPYQPTPKPPIKSEGKTKPTLSETISLFENLFDRPLEDIVADNAPEILGSILGENEAEVKSLMEQAPAVLDTIESMMSRTEKGEDPFDVIDSEIFNGIRYGDDGREMVLSPEVEDAMSAIMTHLPGIIDHMSKNSDKQKRQPAKPHRLKKKKAKDKDADKENPVADAIGSYILKKIFESKEG